MSIGRTRYPDPDDFFADSRMSFGDHLEELRLHLWRAIAGFMIGLIAGFFVGWPLLRFICEPVEAELQVYWKRYYDNKQREVLAAIADGMDAGQPMRMEVTFDEQALHQLGAALGVDIPAGKPVSLTVAVKDPLKMAALLKPFDLEVGRRPSLATFNIQEGFLVYIKVSLVAGFIMASPWIFYQLWSFIAAGLYPHEKKYVNVYLPFSIALFLSGVALCQFLVIPKAVSALLWFNQWLEVDPDFRLNEWLSFAILLPLVFGLSFQTPLVMLFMERVGILTVGDFKSKRGIAWFLMALFAVIILPTSDAYTMLFLWVPMGLLYELGILLCILLPKPPAFDIDVPDSDELIEV
jgi:sec-independent protein translocase protein TatC